MTKPSAWVVLLVSLCLQASPLRILHCLVACLLSSLVVGCGIGKRDAEFVRTIDWMPADRWLLADTHMHTRFSDGRLEVADLVRGAMLHGCQAIAITDHSDRGSASATEEYFEAIELERASRAFPIIVSGLEWNVPPYGGREHVNILVHPDLEPALMALKVFPGDQPASQGFSALAGRRRQPHDIVAFYNHPARRDQDIEENYRDYLTWAADTDVLVGFEGGPGHQKDEPPGDYAELIDTVDGWDPVVAEVGGVWDRLLDEGRDVWGALATSDFHQDRGDYLPCEFSRTHVAVPERTVDGLLQGLRAGAFWAEMGPFLERLDFTVDAPGLVVPAAPGEVFSLGSPGTLTVTVKMTPAAEFVSEDISVEIIGNVQTGMPEVLGADVSTPQSRVLSWSIDRPVAGADGDSAYLRVRVRAKGREGARTLAAYSNAVRIIL